MTFFILPTWAVRVQVRSEHVIPSLILNPPPPKIKYIKYCILYQIMDMEHLISGGC